MRVDAEDARTIGRRVRQVRNARQKSQRVVAERTGISEGYLSRVEGCKRPLDRRSCCCVRATPSGILLRSLHFAEW